MKITRKKPVAAETVAEAVKGSGETVVIWRATRKLTQPEHEQLSQKLRFEQEQSGIKIMLVPQSVEVQVASASEAKPPMTEIEAKAAVAKQLAEDAAEKASKWAEAAEAAKTVAEEMAKTAAEKAIIAAEAKEAAEAADETTKASAEEAAKAAAEEAAKAAEAEEAAKAAAEEATKAAEDEAAKALEAAADAADKNRDAE